MSEFLNVLLCPHQRRKHVQAELERLTPGVVFQGQLDLSRLDLGQMEWAERREGVLARWKRHILDASMPRILSGRLNGPVLLAYICDEKVWGYELYYKGSPMDSFVSLPGYFGPAPADPPPPERRAAWLAQYFPAGREDILGYLIPWTQEELEGGGALDSPSDRHPRGDCWQLEDFLNNLAPWAYGMLTADNLAPTPTTPVPDQSSPKENTPDRLSGQRPLQPEPGTETCLPFLTGVKVLGRSWRFPLSLLYALFPGKRPVPEAVPCQDWTAREVEEVLDRFLTGALDRLELNFTLRGEGAYVRRLRKTVYQTFPFTLSLIREKGRCMCLAFDDQESAVYQLIADRNTYMTVDCKELPQTLFHGQRVKEYAVFPKSGPEAIRREVLFLLARLDHRDDALSAILRMGVWNCEGNLANTDTAKRRHQEIRALWCME